MKKFISIFVLLALLVPAAVFARDTSFGVAGGYGFIKSKATTPDNAENQETKNRGVVIDLFGDYYVSMNSTGWTNVQIVVPLPKSSFKIAGIDSPSSALLLGVNVRSGVKFTVLDTDTISLNLGAGLAVDETFAFMSESGENISLDVMSLGLAGLLQIEYAISSSMSLCINVIPDITFLNVVIGEISYYPWYWSKSKASAKLGYGCSASVGFSLAI